jgi:hypothetical protein
MDLVRMNPQQHDKPTLNCVEASVHTTLTDQRKAIERICLVQVLKTPVIIIIDDEKDQLLK